MTHANPVQSRSGSGWTAAVHGQERGTAVHAMTSAIASNDEAAFNQFYEAYYTRLYRYLLVRSQGSEELVRDALQETMMRVIRHIKPLTSEQALWNWLRRVARTAFIDELRRNKRNVPPMEAARLEARLRDNDERTDSVDPLQDQLKHCLARLEGVERALVEGSYMEGKSHDLLGRELDLSAKAVESRLARIRKKLKTLILERLKDE